MTHLFKLTRLTKGEKLFFNILAKTFIARPPYLLIQFCIFLNFNDTEQNI